MAGMDLATMAERFPDREAVVVDGRRVTYAELDRAANRLAHRLRDAGLRRGDALAVCAGNGIGPTAPEAPDHMPDDA